ncbi:MAG: signal peptidase II [Deltaproteobacteria bacterium]|nr:signal peptidase II [Deltaproteobacteria bacterium]
MVEPSPSPRLGRTYLPLLISALIIIPLDQLTKMLVVDHLTPVLQSASGFVAKIGAFYGTLGHPCRAAQCIETSVIDGFWSFHYAENPGAAWSLLARAPDALRAPFLITVSLFALGFILFYLRKVPANGGWVRIGLSLVFAGAVGNLIDRVRLGYVIDFIHWYAGDLHWPTFNVADSAISTGAVMLLLDALRSREKKGTGELARAPSS